MKFIINSYCVGEETDLTPYNDIWSFETGELDTPFGKLVLSNAMIANNGPMRGFQFSVKGELDLSELAEDVENVTVEGLNLMSPPWLMGQAQLTFYGNGGDPVATFMGMPDDLDEYLEKLNQA